jgi:hypothetical protein
MKWIEKLERQQIRAMLEASDRIMEMVPEELTDLHEYLRK